MSKLKHVGSRPKNNVYQLDNMFKVWAEDLEDGGIKYWNRKTLNSGCDKVLEEVEKKDDLIYCPFCDEMANENQFIKETDSGN